MRGFRYIKKAGAMALMFAVVAGMVFPVYAGVIKKGVIATSGSGASADTNGYSIYISKMNNTLILSRYGAEVAVYDASLGEFSSSGNKNQEGDRKTPNGEYYVCTRNDQSAYYLALGVSYPGIQDAERGLEQGIISAEEHDAIVTAIKAGEQPPWDTALGGYIEIHGNRRSGVGTAGCIALDNSAMDMLWSCCNIGVPITVGP